MNVYLAFLDGDGSDRVGRMFDEILEWDDADLEETHDYIQWLFPTARASGVNKFAPLLTPEIARQVKDSPERQSRVKRAFGRMMRFYGFGFDGVNVGPHDGVRRSWMRPNDHNHLRITRILSHLHEVGLDDLAASFRARLRDLPDDVTTPETRRFWGIV